MWFPEMPGRRVWKGSSSSQVASQENSKKTTIAFLSITFLFTSTAEGVTNGNSMKKEKKKNGLSCGDKEEYDGGGFQGL